MFENRIVRKIFGANEQEVKGGRENYAISRFINCAVRPIILGEIYFPPPTPFRKCASIASRRSWLGHEPTTATKRC
jgi:hypothetical protein